jgi:hypothetical protein
MALQFYEDTLPAFIYSYKYYTDQLHRTSLVTGKQSSHRVPSYTFKQGCYWSEVPGGSLLITGGGYPVVKEVVRIDTRREFAASHCSPMLTPRVLHAAVYHNQHLYVLEGLNHSCLRECERYLGADNQWEALPPLPGASNLTCGVVVESSLYALGGRNDGAPLDLVQKLSLVSLTWELMQLRLPHAGYDIPCFKVSDTEVYLVVNNTLCSFTAMQIRPLKTMAREIYSWRGVSYCRVIVDTRRSYYCRWILYCSNFVGPARTHQIVSLSNLPY